VHEQRRVRTRTIRAVQVAVSLVVAGLFLVGRNWMILPVDLILIDAIAAGELTYPSKWPTAPATTSAERLHLHPLLLQVRLFGVPDPPSRPSSSITAGETGTAADLCVGHPGFGEPLGSR